MASDEGLQAGGAGAGRDKKRAAVAPEPGSNGGATAAPKAGHAAAAGGAAENAPQKPAESPSARSFAKAAAPSDSEDLVVVTLKASGSIVSIEMAASDGSHRHALTESETARLAGERPTFSSLVHDAFEAGIACILDDRPGGADEALGETEEDADLHDALLDALIERSAAKRLLSRETLTSAVLSTIIDAASSGGKAAAPPAA